MRLIRKIDLPHYVKENVVKPGLLWALVFSLLVFASWALSPVLNPARAKQAEPGVGIYALIVTCSDDLLICDNEPAVRFKTWRDCKNYVGGAIANLDDRRIGVVLGKCKSWSPPFDWRKQSGPHIHSVRTLAVALWDARNDGQRRIAYETEHSAPADDRDRGQERPVWQEAPGMVLPTEQPGETIPSRLSRSGMGKLLPARSNASSLAHERSERLFQASRTGSTVGTKKILANLPAQLAFRKA